MLELIENLLLNLISAGKNCQSSGIEEILVSSIPPNRRISKAVIQSVAS